MEGVSKEVSNEKTPSPDPQAAEPPPPAEPKPDPNVKAPAFVWISKGYDPSKPNPGRVSEPEHRKSNEK